MAADDDRLSRRFRERVHEAESRLHVSAVTAFEFADLQRRRRLPIAEKLDGILQRFAMTVLSFPAAAWELAHTVPDLHRDPVDRMLIAHAIHDGLTLVTADRKIRDYPVETLW
jgi:PIN domain nuclease of toxin-antitoxin system